MSEIDVKKFYDSSCLLAEAFMEKQGWVEDDGKCKEYPHWYFIADDPCDIICIGDLYFSLSNIYLDILHDVPVGKIIEWYDECVYNGNTINYRSYLMSLGLLRKNNDKCRTEKI